MPQKRPPYGPNPPMPPRYLPMRDDPVEELYAAHPENAPGNAIPPLPKPDEEPALYPDLLPDLPIPEQSTPSSYL